LSAQVAIRQGYTGVHYHLQPLTRYQGLLVLAVQSTATLPSLLTWGSLHPRCSITSLPARPQIRCLPFLSVLALFLPFNDGFCKPAGSSLRVAGRGTWECAASVCHHLLLSLEFYKCTELDFYPSSGKHLEGFPSAVYK